MLVLAVRASQGSRRSWLCLIGFLAFTAYNYAIYTFSIQFGPLFLLWVAVLGLSVFAAAGSLAGLLPDPGARFVSPAVRLPAWFLIILAVVFALLWLSEIVPDLLAGRPSTWPFFSAQSVPAACSFFAATGSVTPAPGSLIFVGLTSLPILVTPFVAQARGDAPGWVIMVPMSIIAGATLIVLWRLLRTMRPVPTADQSGPS